MNAGWVTSTHWFVCDKCGQLTDVSGAPVQLRDGQTPWECEVCGNESAWRFSDYRNAYTHSARIRWGQ